MTSSTELLDKAAEMKSSAIVVGGLAFIFAVMYLTSSESVFSFEKIALALIAIGLAFVSGRRMRAHDTFKREAEVTEEQV